MRNFSFFKAGIFLVFLMTASVIVWAIRMKNLSPGKRTYRKEILPAKTYDSVLLKKFDRLSASLDMNNTCTYSGSVSIAYGTDTAKSAQNMGFTCCKDGQNCYYQFGRTETLNTGGFFIFIEHDQKKVVIGPQKELSAVPLIKFSQFKKGLLSENYVLTAAQTGKLETITFKNEKHLSCKEYAMTYDTTSMKVTRIFARLPDFSHYKDKGTDEVVDMHLFSWTERAELRNYLKIKDVIRKEKDEVYLTDKYKGYELIRLQ